jgi:hypothetical protein
VGVAGVGLGVEVTVTVAVGEGTVWVETLRVSFEEEQAESTTRSVVQVMKRIA